MMNKLCVPACMGYVMLGIGKVHAAEAGMPQLDTEFWPAQIFWLVLVFSILYLVIWKVFLPKITYSVENRKSRIVNDLDEAQKLKENAEKKLKEYNTILINSKLDAKKIIEDARKKLDKEIEDKKKDLNIQIEKEIFKVEKEIKELRKTSLASISKIASDTSAELIKKIINAEVNQSNVSAIVNDIIKKNSEKYI